MRVLVVCAVTCGAVGLSGCTTSGSTGTAAEATGAASITSAAGADASASRASAVADSPCVPGEANTYKNSFGHIFTYTFREHDASGNRVFDKSFETTSTKGTAIRGPHGTIQDVSPDGTVRTTSYRGGSTRASLRKVGDSARTQLSAGGTPRTRYTRVTEEVGSYTNGAGTFQNVVRIEGSNKRDDRRYGRNETALISSDLCMPTITYSYADEPDGGNPFSMELIRYTKP